MYTYIHTHFSTYIHMEEVVKSPKVGFDILDKQMFIENAN